MTTHEYDRPVRPQWLLDAREGRLMMPEFSREAGDTDDRALLADVAFNRHSMNDGHHVSPFDNSKVQIGTDGVEVALVQGIDETSFKDTLSAAQRATIGIDISDPNALVKQVDWEEMMKGGLQTALESQVIIFAVRGASRTCTHQLVRSRRAAFHQQSQRASYVGDMPECRMPESVWRNHTARRAFIHALLGCWRAYQTACEQDISYQDARFILPEGTTNFILLEYPVREFLNVYAYRGCSMFQWEIVDVMRKCRQALITEHPFMEPYVKISCEKTGPAKVHIPVERLNPNQPNIVTEEVEHHCTFQGWEDVEGQCDFPWAKHEARTYKPEAHRISRNR